MQIKKSKLKWGPKSKVKKNSKSSENVETLTIENLGGYFVFPKLDGKNKPTTIEEWCKTYDN